MSYLAELTWRLAQGANRIDEETRARHRQWLQAQQRTDGGFAGREGVSDPYYTSFALRGLMIVDGLSNEVVQGAEGFVADQLDRKLGVVDTVSLVMAASMLELVCGSDVMSHVRRAADSIQSTLLALRSGDGGYAKTPGGAAGSTYQTFLNLLCWELLEREEPDPAGVFQFVQGQRHVEGGFREIRVAKRAGVNPTAAGIGALKALGRLEPATEAATIDFLVQMQGTDGGFAANDRIPMPDLLSTCTGFISLIDLNAIEGIQLNRLVRYARTMERRDIQTPDVPVAFGMMTAWDEDEDDEHNAAASTRQLVPGGFHGFEFDQDVDVEYTFYGLACLTLAHAVDPPQA